jgi:predicted nuclease of predicted toxin-antitoxin system
VADRLKFYMDEHVPKAVTEGLRRRGVDVITVQELGLQAAGMCSIWNALPKMAA